MLFWTVARDEPLVTTGPWWCGKNRWYTSHRPTDFSPKGHDCQDIFHIYLPIPATLSQAIPEKNKNKHSASELVLAGFLFFPVLWLHCLGLLLVYSIWEWQVVHRPGVFFLGFPLAKLYFLRELLAFVLGIKIKDPFCSSDPFFRLKKPHTSCWGQEKSHTEHVLQVQLSAHRGIRGCHPRHRSSCPTLLRWRVKPHGAQVDSGTGLGEDFMETNWVTVM